MEKLVKKFQIKVVNEDTNYVSETLNNSEKVYDFAKKIYAEEGTLNICESFYVVFLNHGLKNIGYAKISTGGIDSTPVDNRIIVKYAIDVLATACVFIHNHPSGSLSASEQDKNITKILKKDLEYFKIKVLDHVIITNEGYFSFVEEGLL